eukprot:gene30322-36641_t
MFTVALCFWGLLRSLKHAYPSIEKFIFHPLIENNIEYDIFVHTYKFRERYSNVRNGENETQLNFTEYALLNPNYVYLEDQNKFDDNFPYTHFTSLGDPWSNNYVSFKNHMRALNSLFHLTSVVEQLSGWRKKGGSGYDYIIFLRPDVQYLSPLPISLAIKYPNHVFIPDFQRRCDDGSTQPLSEYNDRFLMGPPALALTCFGNKLLYAHNYSKYTNLHSERLTYHVLSQCVYALQRDTRTHNDTSYSKHLFYPVPLPYMPPQPHKHRIAPHNHHHHGVHGVVPSPPPFIYEILFRFRRIRVGGGIDVRDRGLLPPPDFCMLNGTNLKMVRLRSGGGGAACVCPSRPFINETTLLPMPGIFLKNPPPLSQEGWRTDMTEGNDVFDTGDGARKGGQGKRRVACSYEYTNMGLDVHSPGLPSNVTLLRAIGCAFVQNTE